MALARLVTMTPVNPARKIPRQHERESLDPGGGDAGQPGRFLVAADEE